MDYLFWFSFVEFFLVAVLFLFVCFSLALALLHCEVNRSGATYMHVVLVMVLRTEI